MKYVSVELYKLRKSKLFVAACLLVLANVSLAAFTPVDYSATMWMGFMAPFTGFRLFITLGAFVAGGYISVVAFSEFEVGAFRNALAIGGNRTHLYFAKLFSGFMSIVFILTVTIAAFTFIRISLAGFGEAYVFERYALTLLAFLPLVLLACLVYASIFTMITFLIRRSVFTVVACYLYIFAELLMSRNPNSFAAIFPGVFIMGITDPAVSIFTTDMLLTAGFSIAIIIITTAAGVISFNKRNVA